MLPSIRHLLDSDPAVDQSDNNPTSSSSFTSSATMPSPAHQPFQQKIIPQKQSNMIGAERPHLQHNTSEHRKTQHHPHPPYEPLHPPHLHSHQRHHPSYTQSPVTPQGQSSEHGNHPGGYSKDYDRHRLLNEHQGSSRSPPDSNFQYQMDHTSLSRHSPRSEPYSAEYAAESKRDAHELGAPRFSEWSPRTSGDHQGPTPPPLPPHNPSLPSSYRPQQRRASPFDPSVCSSSSSGSPSPSISAVAAATTALAADAIASVTLGTAAATISDTRPWYSQNYGSSRMALPYDSGESTDGYVAPNHHAELSSKRDSDQVLSPTGGLVQPATRYTSRPDSNNRTSYQESVSSSRQLLSPSHADELQDRRTAKPSPKQHQDRHPYSGDFCDQRPPYQPLHRSGPSEESFESEQRYGYPTATVSTSDRPNSPARLASSLSPRLHESGHSPARGHAALPRARASTTADERMFRDRDGARHSEQGRDSFDQTQRQDWRHASLSPPGPSGTHSSPSLVDRVRQHPSPSCYPPSSSFRSPPTYHDHHPSHPSLQQQQQPPPLYDLVRKSDQRTVQYPLSNPSTPQPRANRQALHDQPAQHQDRLHATSSAMSSISLESRSPRQAGFPSQGLATRSNRIASPGPSHPYYASSHPQRPYHSRTDDSDLVIRSSTRGQVKEEESYPHPTRHQHFHSTPLPQVRSSDATQGHHSPSTQSHESLHGAATYEDRNMHSQKQSLDIDRDPGFHERGNGSWSDGGAGAGYEPRTGHKRGGHDNLSESHSMSISSASHWKESERVIRSSLSEPDLTVMDAAQRKRKLAVDLSKDDAEENEEVDNEELEAEEEVDEEVDELEEDEESGDYGSYQHPRQPPHSQQGYAYEYGHGPEPARYSQSPPSRDGQQLPHPPPHFQHPPPHGRPQSMHYIHHPQAPSYHEAHMHQQHPYDYPSQPHQGHPPHHAQRNPRAFSHPYISQFQVQLPQYPQQGASNFHSTYPNGHSADPKVPNRRGPYLSRQRALLAGLETTSPSSRYQCQYCHKRFSRPSSLRIHTYSHTGERPFKCSEEGCGRQFSVQSNMRRHLRVHRLGRMRTEFPSSN